MTKKSTIKEKKEPKVPFKVEIKITDNNGKRIFHWKQGRSNLVLGLKKANEFTEDKLGIELESPFKKARKEAKDLVDEDE